VTLADDEVLLREGLASLLERRELIALVQSIGPSSRSWTCLGLPRALAETFAGLVDWHEIAALVARGCPPNLALEIVR
jgi:hypothetical protein